MYDVAVILKLQFSSMQLSFMIHIEFSISSCKITGRCMPHNLIDENEHWYG